METLQLLGIVTGLSGWVGTILICALPMWRVTSISSNGMVTQSYSDGLWVTCVYESSGQLQCRSYSSVLEITPDIFLGRVTVVFSLVTSFIGIMFFFADRSFGSRNKYDTLAGISFVLSGSLILIPVSWTATNIINNFFTPVVPEDVTRELGAALYIGWISSALLLVSGTILCRLGIPYKQDSYLKDYKEVKTCSPTSYPTKDYV